MPSVGKRFAHARTHIVLDEACRNMGLSLSERLTSVYVAVLLTGYGVVASISEAMPSISMLSRSVRPVSRVSHRAMKVRLPRIAR
jgi:hypothetical protein